VSPKRRMSPSIARKPSSRSTLAFFAIAALAVFPTLSPEPAFAAGPFSLTVANGVGNCGAGPTFTASISCTTVTPTEIETAISTGAVTLEASGDITVNVAIDLRGDNPNNRSLTLRSADDIDVIPGSGIHTGGGALIFTADSDGSGAGGIRVGLDTPLTAPATRAITPLTTGGGDITMGGGFQPSGESASFAGLFPVAADSIYLYSIGLFAAQMDAGGGNISIKGSAGKLSTGLNWTVQIGGAEGTKTSVVTAGSGTIEVHGDGSEAPPAATASNSRNSWAVSISGTLQSASGNITIIGNANTNRTNARGHALSGSFLSSSGAILVEDRTSPTSSINYSGSYLNGAVFGAPSGSGEVTNTGNITVRADKIAFGGAPQAKTLGNVTIEPRGSTFTNNPQVTGIAVTANNVVLGKSGNAAGITLSRAITASGTTEIFSDGTVTQDQPLASDKLVLSGSGTFTLTDAGNNVATLAGGSTSSRLGPVSFTDASDGLTVGTVSSTSGLFSSGAITIATRLGDLTLANTVNSSLASGDSVRLFAGQSQGIGSSDGGNIIVVAQGAVSVENGARALLYSGARSTSSGLLTYVGGESNARSPFGPDTALTSISPSLGDTGKFAIFRLDEVVYLVEFDTQGGSALANGLLVDGGSISLPQAPNRDGFSFAGWFLTAANGTALSDPYTPGIYQDFTLYAQWTVIPQSPPQGNGAQSVTPPAISPPQRNGAQPVTPPANSPSRTTTPNRQAALAEEQLRDTKAIITGLLNPRNTPHEIPAFTLVITAGDDPELNFSDLSSSFQSMKIQRDQATNNVIFLSNTDSVTVPARNVRMVRAGGLTFVLYPIDSSGESVDQEVADEFWLTPGGQVRVVGSGLEAGSAVRAWIFSTPQELGVFTLDNRGEMVTTFQIPEKLEPGWHTLKLVAPTSNAEIVTLELDVFALSNELSSISETPPPSPTDDQSSAAWWLVGPVIVMVLLLLLLVTLIRRRTRVS
jgi:uncharacterized repeat protein (TIGR02543 family)